MLNNNLIPAVSVLMPTFKQAAFIRRALESLRSQTFQDWELIVVDDGSPDETGQIIESYLSDNRIHYHRLPKNQGLGAALNTATSLARGNYLAYLPSDDIYYPDHLARLVQTLDNRPEIYLAYGGVRWDYEKYGPTLQGEEAVGREAEALAQPIAPPDAKLSSGNILALVQVMHRRGLEEKVSWTPRTVLVSDKLEPDFWRDLLGEGARFAYAGKITCEWVDHPLQHHKNIVGKFGGLAFYRNFYGVGRGEWLDWQPSKGWHLNERSRFGRFDAERDLPAPGGLKILLVGELGFNPERIIAFEEQGHKLYGLWISHPEIWDTIGPLPFGNVEDIPYDRNWIERVKEIKPDVIYALLNWQALELIFEVKQAQLDIPFVFHFKEGPFITLEHGTWPGVLNLFKECEGLVFISEENYEWFQLTTGNLIDPDRAFILDGDLPKLDWQTSDWQPKLSEQDGQVHTLCSGRPLGMEPFEELAANKVNVHFYGNFFHSTFPNWTRKGLATGYMHLHPTVEPADWVSELSRYDAAWFHVFDSYNEGDLRKAHWDDLNLAARLGTYAAAGLPWILKDNRHSCVAVQSLAVKHDIGVFYSDFTDLAAKLRDRSRLDQMTANMRRVRGEFAFDTHVADLVAFFRKAISRKEEKNS